MRTIFINFLLNPSYLSIFLLNLSKIQTNLGRRIVTIQDHHLLESQLGYCEFRSLNLLAIFNEPLQAVKS